ncbi:MAG: twin-arginine translocase TatA/TatE family subunit [Nitriliruptoraceae bacterium]|nr:twin-arginine translocase TatA/TatE family subunit [Nitriliruptoraceae bacterium]
MGWQELVIILAVLLLLFGARKLPELAGSLGTSIKEFRKATEEASEGSGDDADGAEPGADAVEHHDADRDAEH